MEHNRVTFDLCEEDVGELEDTPTLSDPLDVPIKLTEREALERHKWRHAHRFRKKLKASENADSVYFDEDGTVTWLNELAPIDPTHPRHYDPTNIEYWRLREQHAHRVGLQTDIEYDHRAGADCGKHVVRHRTLSELDSIGHIWPNIKSYRRERYASAGEIDVSLWLD